MIYLIKGINPFAPEARVEVAEGLRINPKFSLDFFAKRSLIKEQSKRDKVVNALHNAGLK